MPHVSRKKLKKKIFVRIGNQLAGAVAKSISPQQVSWFVDKLLTPTERVMLAKRLAVTMMLERGYSIQAIRRSIKVTSQTILRLKHKMKLRVATNKITVIKKPNARFWQELEGLLLLGMPSKFGTGRWDFVRKAMGR